jgi:predicted transposase YdaD
MALEQEKNMPYVTSVERIGLRRGLDRGRKEGRQEGRKEGRKEGRQEGEATVLLRLIELKFGPPDAALRNRVESADSETLLRWSERILTAGSLEELFA